MNKLDFLKLVSREIQADSLISSDLLQLISQEMQAYRDRCKRENDSDLRAFAELAFPELVNKAAKSKRTFWRRVMSVDWIKSMVKNIGFDSPNHCQAIKEAYAKYTQVINSEDN